MNIVPIVRFRYGSEDMEIQKSCQLESFYYQETAYATAVYLLSVTTPYLDRWDRLISNEERKEGVLEWGVGTPDGEILSGERIVRCNQCSFDISHYGPVVVQAAGTCSGYQKLWSCRQKAYRDKTVSQIVQKIAEGCDLKSDVTGTRGMYTLYQGKQSDWDFLLGDLRSRAITGEGRADFYVFIDKGDTLVFKVPDLNASPEATFVMSRKMGRNSNLTNIKVNYRELDQKIDGSSYTRVVGFDQPAAAPRLPILPAPRRHPGRCRRHSP